MKIIVNIILKKGVLDPQGLAIKSSLSSLGFNNVNAVKQGKIIEIDLDEENFEKAKITAGRMCEELLANTVIEDYTIKSDQ